MPVLVLAGDEDFELYRRLEEWKGKLLDPAWATFNYSRLDNPSGNDVCDLASAIPFGPGNKVIIIDRCDWFAKKRSGKGEESTSKKAAKASGKDSVNEDQLAESLASVHPNTYLVFVATSNFDTTLRLSKLVAKHAQIEDFPREKYFTGSQNVKLENWCRKEAKRFSATIDDDAVRYLLDGLEANLRHISSEIEKAAIYILPEKQITLSVVEKLSPHHSHVFSVAEHWLAGDYQATLQSLRELLSKQPAMAVLATMQTLMSKWVNIKVMVEALNDKLPYAPGVQRRELPAPELAKRLSADLKVHPFVLEKDIKRLVHVSSRFLIEKRLELTRLENLVKTGQMPELHALELFFVGELKPAGGQKGKGRQ